MRTTTHPWQAWNGGNQVQPYWQYGKHLAELRRLPLSVKHTERWATATYTSPGISMKNTHALGHGLSHQREPCQELFIPVGHWIHSVFPFVLLMLNSQRNKHRSENCPTGLTWWLRQYRICLHCRSPRFDILSQEDTLEKGIATHSSILAWRIPCIEEPGGLQSMGFQRVKHD